MHQRFITVILIGLLSSLNCVAQVTIVASGPADVCNGVATLDVVSPQPGWVYGWYVNTNTCAGTTPVPIGPIAAGTSFAANFTGEFFCIGTDPGSNQYYSNIVPLRVLPGSMSSSLLPRPYPVDSVSCSTGVSFCIPVDFYQNFPTTIKWYHNNLLIPGATSPAYSPVSNGWYKYSVTSPCMTDFSDSVHYEFMLPPVITGVTSFCQGTATVLTASPGYTTYLWSNGATTQSINVSTAGAYTVTVTSNGLCTATETTVVTVNPNPMPVITGDSTLCIGQTATLNGGGMYTSYLWFPGGQATQTIVATMLGVYTVIVTDANGCTGTDNIQVTGPTATMSGNNSICNGSSTDLIVQFSGTSPFMYTYSDGVNTYGPFTTISNPEVINVSPATNTTYFLVSYSDLFCNGFVSGSATIIAELIPAITGDTTLCPGQVTVLDAGGPYLSYIWSTGAASQTIIVSTLNTYTVTVTDVNGCTGTNSVTVITAPPYLTALTAPGPLGLCLGDSTQLFAQFPMNSYQWYKNNSPITGATGGSFWASASGKYHCLMVDNAGCPAISNQLRVSVVCFPPLPPSDKVEQIGGEPIDIILYPNPSEGALTFRFNREIDVPYTIRLLDVSGKLIMNEHFDNTSGHLVIKHDNPGYYLLEIHLEGDVRIRKPVVFY